MGGSGERVVASRCQEASEGYRRVWVYGGPPHVSRGCRGLSVAGAGDREEWS